LNRLTNLSVSSPACSLPRANCAGNNFAGYQYALGLAGNRNAVTEISGRTVQYGYDNLYRLTSEAISNDLGGQIEPLATRMMLSETDNS